HTLVPERELEGKRVRMGMTWHVVWPGPADISQQHCRSIFQACISAACEQRGFGCSASRRRHPKSTREGRKLVDRGSTVERAIVELGRAAIGMRKHAEPPQHVHRLLADEARDFCSELAGERSVQVKEIEQVLQKDRVIHRRKLEMTAIGQHL